MTDLLAHRLAALMLARASAGLVRGYVEREVSESHLRGRIDLPSQLRRQFRQPTLFDQIADEWTADVPFNQIPKATAVRLLAEPELGGEARAALGQAVAAFDGVSDTPPTAAERTDPPEAYRELFDWCELIGGEHLLVSLERAFEGYATRVFREALGGAVRPQEPIPFGGGLTLTPDLTVFRGPNPASVWDAKWKRPDPTAADVHQALAYAAALGVPHCGLVYPGRRWKVDTLRAGSGVALHLLRLPLTDDPVRMRRVTRRVRRVLTVNVR